MFHSLRIFSHLQDKNHTETTLTTRGEGGRDLSGWGHSLAPARAVLSL